ncbi:hypothetical protein [Erythrobacter sp. EC-HK427]|uniref:hypothetical protein n=1 Tax=Erythrobacter sp. EC-HK427 TaxID=2038396 RepID=UPI00125F3569|nr:hypothetical protein [Erythrobacter sp. EC-HK427]
MASIAPVLGTRTAFAAPFSRGLINPPTEPMRFSRVLRRGLGDGREITIARSFSVHFAPAQEGFDLAGRQAEVEVDLPEQLAAFAELERARDDSAMFPISLDPFGQIAVSRAPAPMSAQVEAAVAQALAAIDRQGHAPGDRERLRQFALAVHNGGGAITAHMPVDLFAPAGGQQEFRQTLALEDGMAGEVRTLFDGETDAETGLMQTAWREIVTEVEGDRRTSREEWTLGLA